jgi:hypothetical protein
MKMKVWNGEVQYPFRYGKKGLRKLLGGWRSSRVMPGNKFFKRKANRRVRYDEDVPDGNYYKKLWGWTEYD